jgi:hypothetical protein
MPDMPISGFSQTFKPRASAESKLETAHRAEQKLRIYKRIVKGVVKNQ